MQHRNIRSGFTLIELLVVIAIIGLLASVVIASLSTARQKGRDARRIADLKAIQTANELYYDSNGEYATSTDALTSANYLPQTPTDPLNQTAYFYSALDTDGDGDTCEASHVGAILEIDSNSALDTDADGAAGTICTDGGTAFDGSGAACTDNTGTELCYDIVSS